jgi:thiamine-phosphate pyrophosphorylase
MPARVRVVVITDRRQYASEEIAGRVAAIVAAVPRGTVAIQVREKDLDGGLLSGLATEVIEVASAAGAPVWINDRVDVALAVGAHGVHLPERGLAIGDAQVVARLIGCSRHDPASALAAAREGAALVQLGPIWETPGKGVPLGASVLAVRAELADAVQLVAVGGIDRPERARAAAAAGADAVAVIRAAWGASDPGAAIAALVEAVETGARTRGLPT